MDMPAIAPHKTGTTDVAWDEGVNRARLKLDQEATYYKSGTAWFSASGDPKAKGSYKFLHHMVTEAGDVGDANLRACSAIIANLNGGRNAARIPAADRRGVYDHAAKHIRDAGKTAPELKSLDQVEAENEALVRDGVLEEMERRIVPLECEIREGDGTSAPEIYGHASVFDTPADLGWFIETVKPGAFSKTIQEDDIRALFNHDANMVLGRNRAKPAPTLFLNEDTVGLAMRIVPATRSYELDLMQSIRRGDVTQASIGFQTRSRVIREDEDNLYRDLLDVKLFDVSPVTFPAFTSTDVNIRSLRAIAHTEFRRGPEDAVATVDEAWKRDIDRRRRMLELVR